MSGPTVLTNFLSNFTYQHHPYSQPQQSHKPRTKANMTRQIHYDINTKLESNTKALVRRSSFAAQSNQNLVQAIVSTGPKHR